MGIFREQWYCSFNINIHLSQFTFSEIHFDNYVVYIILWNSHIFLSKLFNSRGVGIQTCCLMVGSSCPKIREGCRPAGGCEGRCVMHRLCCIAGKGRLKIGMLGFETAPGPAGVVFSLSRHCSSGFQTHGLLSGLLTAKWAGDWPASCQKFGGITC